MSLYVALEGPDGSGKSSQAVALVATLQERGHDVLHVREPGSTPVGEALRELLLDNDTGELLPVTEALLFSAARAELVQREIAPALAAGGTVVSERCFLATAAYQVVASEASPAVMDAAWFDDLTRRVHGSCLPAAVFVLDVPAEVSAQRRGERRDDRIEARGAAYHARVREAFLELARREPRAVVIDATRSFEEVQRELVEHVVRRLIS